MPVLFQEAVNVISIDGCSAVKSPVVTEWFGTAECSQPSWPREASQPLFQSYPSFRWYSRHCHLKNFGPHCFTTDQSVMRIFKGISFCFPASCRATWKHPAGVGSRSSWTTHRFG